MKLISALIGLVLLVYIAFAPIYLLFYNSSEDAAEDLSLYSAMMNDATMLEDMGVRGVPGNLKNIVVNMIKIFRDWCVDEKNIDIEKSIFKLIKDKYKDVKLVNMKKKMGIGWYRGDVSDVDLFILQWKTENRNKEILYAVRKPSFFEMRRAKAYIDIDGNIEMLLSLYGLNMSDLSVLQGFAN